MDNQDKKRELIIETALKRFAHFGLSKTTMNEIASDMSLSKALLYYYFPDKIRLYIAVIKHLISHLHHDLLEGLSKIDNSFQSLIFYLDKRQEFLNKYYNLLELSKLSHEQSEELINLFKDAKQSETVFLADIIKKGADSGEFDVNDPLETADLLVDAINGLRLINIQWNGSNFMPEKQQFDIVVKRQKQLGEVFLRGLRKHHT